MKEKNNDPSKKEFENNHILDYTIFFAVRQVESANFLAKIITLLKNCHFGKKIHLKKKKRKKLNDSVIAKKQSCVL